LPCTRLAPAGNETLYSLNLANNGIGNRGARALAEALKLNTHLARLDISGNNIDAEGAGALAEALEVSTTLEAIYINENYLGGWAGGQVWVEWSPLCVWSSFVCGGGEVEGGGGGELLFWRHALWGCSCASQRAPAAAARRPGLWRCYLLLAPGAAWAS
jgi:hypothetical protein